MTWPDTFRVITAAIVSLGGGGALVLAMSSWLSKLWAARILERERATYAKELENRKAELTRLTAEHQIRYTRLHERQAEVIAEVYAKLEDLHDAIRFLAKLRPAPVEQERIDELENARQHAADASRELEHYFNRQSIWLDQETCERTQIIISLLKTTTRGLQYHLFGWQLPDERLDKIERQLADEIPGARRLLDHRFRTILRTGEPRADEPSGSSA